MALEQLRKLRCTTIRTPAGDIKLDQIEAQVPLLQQDLKTTDDKKSVSLAKLPSLARFLTPTQKLDILPLLLPIVQNSVNLSLPGLTLLVELIDSTTITKILADGWVPQLHQVITLPDKHKRNMGFRCLCKLAGFKQSIKAIGNEAALTRIIAELSQTGSPSPSSYAVQLLADLMEDPVRALAARNAVAPLVALLRATSPVKCYSPAIRALRNMTQHDDRALRIVIEAGAIPLLSGLMRSPPPMFHQEVPFEAAILICEFANTKNIEIQDLLVQQNVGSPILMCLTSNRPDVKRGAIIAVERWMYADDRMINLSIEFFSKLAETGVHVSPRFKALLDQLKPSSSQVLKSPPITNLIAEITKRKEPDEILRLNQENSLLRSRLASEEKRAQMFDTFAKQQIIAPPPTTPSKQPTVEELIKSTKELKELEVMERLIAEKRKDLHEKEVENLKDILLCNICIDKKKNASLNPCGHTFCEDCAKKVFAQSLSQRKCPTCRQSIASISKLYF